jgi:hypothetical protein
MYSKKELKLKIQQYFDSQINEDEFQEIMKLINKDEELKEYYDELKSLQQKLSIIKEKEVPEYSFTRINGKIVKERKRRFILVPALCIMILLIIFSPFILRSKKIRIQIDEEVLNYSWDIVEENLNDVNLLFNGNSLSYAYLETISEF